MPARALYVAMNVDLHESLSGQTALVTGANRGIGAEIAARLVDLGATVYAGARDPETVTATHQEPVELDVTDMSQVAAAMERLRAESGRLDVLVNNAGVYGPQGQYGDVDTAAIDRTLRTNLLGPMLVTRYALPLLVSDDRSGARVVNVSSGSGQFADGIDDSHLPYGVSKAGLNAFTQGLARQYPSLYVNAACPGWVRTDMGGEHAPRSVAEGAKTPVFLARLRDGPSGRLWRDEELEPW